MTRLNFRLISLVKLYNFMKATKKFTAPKTILVTGCAGFIGSNFTRVFAQQFPKTKIIGIDDLSSGRKDLITKEVDFQQGTILDTDFLKKVFTKYKPEYIFHFAAIPRVSYSVEHPAETSAVNIVGTIQLLEKAKDFGVKRFVFSSSSAIYGGAKILPTTEHENKPDPKSPYAMQKYAIEPFCKIFGELYGLDTVCLRYFNVFGPGQYGDSAYSTVISAWLEKMFFPVKGKKAFLEGNGSQSRDFCYVDNVVDANIKAMLMTKKSFGEIFNIANGERTTVLEVKKLIEKFTGRKIDLELRPGRVGDVKHTHADVSKAKKWFGYTPTVDFVTGLKRTITWFESRQK